MNKKEAVLCAYVARAAYTNRCKTKDFLLTAKFENKGTDTQGIFGVAYNRAFVIGFRGSEETGISDWVTDLKIDLEPFPYSNGDNIKAHQGFIEAYESVRDAVMSGINDSPHKRIICTGHSLGGALATLCALDIQANVSGKMAYCYTYGSPKVGDANFADVYNKQVPRTFRFVNGSDIIPSLPPGSYEHVGELYSLSQEEDESSGLSAFVSDLVDKFEDHLPNQYIKSLKANL